MIKLIAVIIVFSAVCACCGRAVNIICFVCCVYIIIGIGVAVIAVEPVKQCGKHFIEVPADLADTRGAARCLSKLFIVKQVCNNAVDLAVVHIAVLVKEQGNKYIVKNNNDNGKKLEYCFNRVICKLLVNVGNLFKQCVKCKRIGKVCDNVFCDCIDI
ncbi:unknown [Anaerotruncus sp. CAG:528]|nr:unknown [Anaerotruncus sp. CAG:528]